MKKIAYFTMWSNLGQKQALGFGHCDRNSKMAVQERSLDVAQRNQG